MTEEFAICYLRKFHNKSFNLLNLTETILTTSNLTFQEMMNISYSKSCHIHYDSAMFHYNSEDLTNGSNTFRMFNVLFK
jgi:hypothetical protein